MSHDKPIGYFLVLLPIKIVTEYFTYTVHCPVGFFNVTTSTRKLVIKSSANVFFFAPMIFLIINRFYKCHVVIPMLL